MSLNKDLLDLFINQSVIISVCINILKLFSSFLLISQESSLSYFFSNYKIRITGARSKEQLDDIINFMKVLINLYTVIPYFTKQVDPPIIKKSSIYNILLKTGSFLY